MHKTHILENGFKVVFIPRKESQICSINIHLNAGSIYDEKGFNYGTSHFVEHMIFNGAKKYPNRNTLLNKILSKGGKRGALTSHFEQRHFVTISKEYIEIAFEYLSQTLLYPNLTEENFFKERAIILAELAKNESSTERFFYTKGVNTSVFKTKVLQNYPLGNVDSIKTINLEGVRLFHSTFFIANRMTLFISGNYSQEEIVELSKKYFAVKELKKKPRKETPIKLELNNPNNTKIKYEGRKNVMISCAQFLPKISGSKYLSLLFLMQILSVGVQSRLFIELREKRSLVYDIYPNNMCTQHGFLVGVVTQSSKENISEIKKIILSEIKNISINSVKEQELIRIKNRYKQTITEQSDSTIGICDKYYNHYKKFGSFYNFEKEAKRITLISLENIKESAQQLLKNKMNWIEMSSK